MADRQATDKQAAGSRQQEGRHMQADNKEDRVNQTSRPKDRQADRPTGGR